jgi:hypothetical protein
MLCPVPEIIRLQSHDVFPMQGTTNLTFNIEFHNTNSAQTHFCYLCGAWLNSSNPYAHFNDQKNKACYQRLMDMAEGDGGGDGQFGGRRGAENLADFYEQEAMRIQMEEDQRTERI